jgi:nicotinate-nucleotide adenylyltransferase
MAKKRLLGIYGGSFNPPHLGHVRAAKALLDMLSLDELLVIPAAIPPHKQLLGDAGTDQRLEMTRLAFSDISGITVSDMEIKRGGKSYTVDTLRALKDDNTDLYLLMGTDMFLTLDLWYKPDEICALCTICVARRESDPDLSRKIEEKLSLYKEKLNIKAVFIDYIPVELSSTEVRDMIKDNKSLANLIPQPVIDYIKKEGIYL